MRLSPPVFAALLSLAAGSLLVPACVPTDEPKRETCGNGIDDDDNGLTDCADPDCSGQSECPAFDAGYWGTCSKCGQACAVQVDCLTQDYLRDRPLPQCRAGKCEAVNKFIQVRLDLDTKSTWAGLSTPVKSGSTRFIKKLAVDGSVVTCAGLAATADRVRPTALEASGKYTLLGLDITPVSNTILGQGVTYPFVNTSTGNDFLIWTDIWTGDRDANSLPTGRRVGYGCFESADVGGPLVFEDNCPNATVDGGTCRIFKLKMPSPEPWP